MVFSDTKYTENILDKKSLTRMITGTNILTILEFTHRSEYGGASWAFF